MRVSSASHRWGEFWEGVRRPAKQAGRQAGRPGRARERARVSKQASKHERTRPVLAISVPMCSVCSVNRVMRRIGLAGVSLGPIAVHRGGGF